MNDIILGDGERLDEIGFGGIKLIQKPEEFCYGIDAVLLSDFTANCQTKAKKFKKIADLGTGTGIVPFVLSHKIKDCQVLGVEIQENSFQRFKRNIEINKLEDRITAYYGDVKSVVRDEKLCGSFDAVTSNPPYTAGNRGLQCNNQAKYIARHETTASLNDFVYSASKLLKDKGDLCMVHRPSRLVDIFSAFRNNKIEPKTIRFVKGKEDDIPNIVLVHGIKNSGSELKFIKDLIVYNNMSKYTEEINIIYEK